MSKRKDVNVQKTRDGNWAVKVGGDKVSQHSTQKRAIENARPMAKSMKTELKIFGENGRIREKNSYGKDPYPPKG